MTQALPPEQGRDEIAQLAHDIMAGRVYTHHSVPPGLILAVFTPVALGALKDYSFEQLGQIIVWASRGRHNDCLQLVSGYPMFTECSIWRQTDFQAALTLVDEIEERLDPHREMDP
jgi:hypothetical protein